MLPSFPRLPANDPAKRGQPASPKILFGFGSRYAIAPVHSRFGELEFFVWDVEQLDSDGNPDVIRQELNVEAACAGLDLDPPDAWFED